MTGKSKYLQAEFIGFMDAIGLAHAPQIQQREMLRAFMAGAKAFVAISERLGSDGDDFTEQDEALMTALDAEINDFPMLVMRGDA